MKRNRWLLIAALAILGVVLLAGPRGCTSTTVSIGKNTAGSPGAQVAIDPPLLSGAGLAAATYSHSITKIDWLFVVTYRLTGRADLSSLPKGARQSYIYTATLPGSITSSNASTVQDNVPTWALNSGFTYVIEAGSREVRWWLIVLVAVLVAAAAILWATSRRART